MDGLDTGASVFSEAKGEYTKQLILFILPVFHRFFMSCLQQASQEEPNSKRQLWKFQELLSTIPEWNIDKVQRETSRLISEIPCDYLEDLVTAVFVAHTKILTAIRIGNRNKRVQITIPKLDHFLHRALSECSRLLWSSAYLFHNELSPIEKQKNHRQIEQLLNEGISQAIRGLLPVKNILKDYLADSEDNAEEEDEKEEKEEKDEKDEKEDKDEKDEKENFKGEAVEEPKQEQVEKPAEESIEKPLEPPTELPIEKPIEQIQESTPLVIKEEVKLEQVVHTVPITPEPTPQIPEPVVHTQQNNPPPTFIVDTEPTVRFTDFNQVIQQKGDHTSIDYVHTNHESEFDNGVEFLDDEDGALSDVEDLTDYPSEPLGTNDFETL